MQGSTRLRRGRTFSEISRSPQPASDVEEIRLDPASDFFRSALWPRCAASSPDRCAKGTCISAASAGVISSASSAGPDSDAAAPSAMDNAALLPARDAEADDEAVAVDDPSNQLLGNFERLPRICFHEFEPIIFRPRDRRDPLHFDGGASTAHKDFILDGVRYAYRRNSWSV